MLSLKRAWRKKAWRKKALSEKECYLTSPEFYVMFVAISHLNVKERGNSYAFKRSTPWYLHDFWNMTQWFHIGSRTITSRVFSSYRRNVAAQQFMYGTVFHFNPEQISTKPWLKSAELKSTDLKQKSFKCLLPIELLIHTFLFLLTTWMLPNQNFRMTSNLSFWEIWMSIRKKPKANVRLKAKLKHFANLPNLDQLLIECPAIVSIKNASLIDLIFVNNSHRVVNKDEIHLPLSDHSLV